MASTVPICPKCGKQTVRCIETNKHINHIRRRKVCKTCDHHYTTYEVSAEYFEQLKRAEETVKRIRSCFQFDSTARVVTGKRCEDCMYMEPEGCSMEFPEAGGDFAEECSLYTALS